MMLLGLVNITMRLRRKRSKPGKATRLPDGTLHLRYGKAVAAVGIVAGILVLLTILLGAPIKTISDFFSAVFVVGGFGGMSVFLLLLYSRVIVAVTDEGVEKASILGKRTFVAWPDIRKLYFSNNRRAFVIVDHDDREVDVKAQMLGMEEFIQVFEEKLDPSVCQGARVGYEQWRRRPLPSK